VLLDFCYLTLIDLLVSVFPRLFRLDPEKAGQLYSQIGVDYVDVVVAPEAASATRGLTSESEAKELYTSGRNKIQDALKQELMATLGPRGIIVEDVLLKDIRLPDQLVSTGNTKESIYLIAGIKLTLSCCSLRLKRLKPK
jgi:regulator of protease activity HflC (stomatin/prohibitin superfamily)